MRSDSGAVASSFEEGVRDAQLAALADPQRRRLLQYLLEQDSASVTLSAAVAHLGSTTDRAYEQVETLLVHRHLPKLEDAALVAYDPQEELLTYIGDEFVTEVLGLL